MQRANEGRSRGGSNYLCGLQRRLWSNASGRQCAAHANQPLSEPATSQSAAWAAPTEKVLDAVAAPSDSVMASPSTKIMGPHRSQLRSAADCCERSLNGNTTMTCSTSQGTP